MLLVVVGVFLAASPAVTARVLGLPHDTPTQWINLRASWGGTLAGLGAFVVWLPALRPWLRSGLGLAMWTMAGIGLARALGFVVDGEPDGRQLVWITAEAAIVAGCAFALRRRAPAARR